jgi:hypothetical protein
MASKSTFDDVLESADRLSPDAQEELLDILQRRITEQRRKDLILEVRKAQNEFESGQCKPSAPDDLMEEIQK